MKFWHRLVLSTILGIVLMCLLAGECGVQETLHLSFTFAGANCFRLMFK